MFLSLPLESILNAAHALPCTRALCSCPRIVATKVSTSVASTIALRPSASVAALVAVLAVSVLVVVVLPEPPASLSLFPRVVELARPRGLELPRGADGNRAAVSTGVVDIAGIPRADAGR
jgi:hypothetical protein